MGVVMTLKQMHQVKIKGQKAILSHPTDLQLTEQTSEQKEVTSLENILVGAEMDALGASGSIEDAGNWPMNLQDMSECECKFSEQWKENDSPGKTSDELDGKTAISRCAQKVQEGPTGVRDKSTIKTKVLH